MEYVGVLAATFRSPWGRKNLRKEGAFWISSKILPPNVIFFHMG
jgi:hypothetical protein